MKKNNVYSITPHRLVFSKNEYNLLVLYYDEYHETDELFFVDGEKYTLQGIKWYVRNYFISKTSNKPTKDSTMNNTKKTQDRSIDEVGVGNKKTSAITH